MEKAIQRQRVLLEHLQPNSSNSFFQPQSTDLSASFCAAGNPSYGRTGASEDDVVIVAAYRTAICKAKRGGFKDTHPDDLLASVLKAAIKKTNVDPSEVGDIVVGTVLAPGADRAAECRLAAFYAGFPETVPFRTVNRICSSGLQAVADVAAYIKAGFYDIGIGAGLEYMSQDSIPRLRKNNPKIETLAHARYCFLPMGITSENLAQRYGVTRQEQDHAAVESHKRAAAATAAGKFKEEIIPVSTKILDPKTGEVTQIIVSVDDCVRPNTTLMDLAKLKPAFQKDGSTTAGNSSQVSDGAAAVLLMKRKVALQRGLPVLGIFRSFTTVGVDPTIKGIGLVYAIPAAVKSAGLELGNIDLFEINEAFASMLVYCCKKLALDPKKVNVNGGAIALGHPLGATGSGMGAAAVFERGDI